MGEDRKKIYSFVYIYAIGKNEKTCYLKKFEAEEKINPTSIHIVTLHFLNFRLASSPEAKHEVKRRLLLNVVVRKGASVFELLARKDETLLIRGNALLVLDLGLDVLNRVRRLDVERDSLARERLYKDLHTSPEAKHEVKRRLLLNVVVSNQYY